MAQYDEEQGEVVKRWLGENWLALVAGLAIGLGAIFGWQGWQARQATRAAEASRLYEQLRDALEQGEAAQAAELADTLAQDFAASPYDEQAALLLARHAATGADYEQAARRLRQVVDGNADEIMVQLARLRLARVLWAQGDSAAAIEQLDAGGAGQFAALFEELRGDILLSQGDRAAARQAYQRALEAGSEAAADRELLRQKLDSLSDVVAS